MASASAASRPGDACDTEDPASGAWQWRGGWQRWVFPAVWLVYLGQTLDGIRKHSSGASGAIGIVILVVFATGYLVALPTSVDGQRRTWTAIVVLVCLTGIESVFAHEDALVMCVFIAVLAMALGGRAGPLFVAAMTVVAVLLPRLIPSWHTGIDWDMLVTIPLVASAMYGFFTIIRSARELAAARAEVVRLAAENERTRIARDLHDVLGHSLTTITVKSALAARLVERDPDRAEQEIRDVEALSRSTLADVRAAVAGYREVTLAGELATAKHVLQSAGITPDLPGAIDVVPGPLHELFGWAVREGVTNVVRHGRASVCTITFGVTWLQIDDDGNGVPHIPAARPAAGTGLLGLRERVEAAGGTVTSGPSAAGWTLRIDVLEVREAREAAAAAAAPAVPDVRVAPLTARNLVADATRAGAVSGARGGAPGGR
ncbi:MAG: sensor histidine kinase [Ilumatobacteraceae bacterium]